MHRDTFYPFYGWLIFSGLLLFAAYLLWRFELLQQLISSDLTYLSVLILCAFALVTAWLGMAAWRLSTQNQRTRRLKDALAEYKHDPSHTRFLERLREQPGGWARQHLELSALNHRRSGDQKEALLASLVEQVHRGHASGWFLSDLLIRLGLIGTVIGFILMLSTVYELKDEDVQALKQLLSTMGSGMQIALYTTLAGMGSGLLVSIQCQWLDRCADDLLSRIIRLNLEAANHLQAGFSTSKNAASNPPVTEPSSDGQSGERL